MIAEGRRFRIGRIEDRALRYDDIDRLHHALVVRDVGIDHLQEGEDRRRRARGVGAVDEAVGLRVGIGVVEGDMPVLDPDPDADREGTAFVAAVVIDVALAIVLAVGNLADLRLHHLARGVEEGRFVRPEAVDAVFPEQLLHAALSDRAGADLCPHVVLHDVQADVGEDQVPHVLAQSCRARRP